jgi:hypothetical protein
MHAILSGGGWKRNLAARGDFFLLLGAKPPESFSFPLLWVMNLSESLNQSRAAS